MPDLSRLRAEYKYFSEHRDDPAAVRDFLRTCSEQMPSILEALKELEVLRYERLQVREALARAIEDYDLATKPRSNQ